MPFAAKTGAADAAKVVSLRPACATQAPRIPQAPRFTQAKRKAFLANLALTAHVTASARVAGISSSMVYHERLRSADFCAAWHRALCEGYARLEADLLAEALIAASGNVSEKTLKSRAQKYQLGLKLLTAHHASVRSEGLRLPAKTAKASRTAQQRLEARYAAMHARLTRSDEPC
jgi:hypothetical protein